MMSRANARAGRRRDVYDRPVSQTADVAIIGAGVQGTSLAFHLAKRGASVVVFERESVGAGATGRSSGFVRTHYDLEADAALAWASLPYFREWDSMVGSGDCSFVQTGFLQLVPAELADALRANVAMQQRIGIDTRLVDAAFASDLVPGMKTDDIVVAAYEPLSGYADPSGSAAGFLSAARKLGARLVSGRGTAAVTVDGDRVTGVESDGERWSAPVVVDAAGAWAGALANSVGVEIPIQPWRHHTAYFGLPAGRSADFPVVIDIATEVYFRPEGRELMLVGLETYNEMGGSPDRPETPFDRETLDAMIEGIYRRVPWMESGTFRTAHGGQDGMTPDQRPILGQAGPQGFYLDCGHSGTGFKTAPAVGASMAELILDGQWKTVDISGYALERFAEGRMLEGKHPYGMLWR
jgi:sarcosine oxidase subunit beta